MKDVLERLIKGLYHHVFLKTFDGILSEKKRFFSRFQNGRQFFEFLTPKGYLE